MSRTVEGICVAGFMDGALIESGILEMKMNNSVVEQVF